MVPDRDRTRDPWICSRREFDPGPVPYFPSRFHLMIDYDFQLMFQHSFISQPLHELLSTTTFYLGEIMLKLKKFMGESSKFPKSQPLENQNLKLASSKISKIPS